MTALDPGRPTTSAPEDLVVRSRQIGANQALVVNGGGNTSAKGVLADHLGRARRVLWVKASGGDLATGDAGAYPALWIEELEPLRGLDAIDDAEMIRLVRRALVDPAAARPSIETLLHAFLPAAHVDHVHADAICALTNQAHGREVVREVLGERFAYLDWLRPGFELARLVADHAAFDGVVLAHHGLVTWADDSDACLARTLDAVRAADDYLAANARPTAPARVPDLADDDLETLLLHLRGALSRTGRRILRVDPRLRDVADRADAAAIVAGGVPTGDHMLWIKPRAVLLDAPRDQEAVTAAIAASEAGYTAYYEANKGLLEADIPMHDPLPRVALVPGLGAITTGVSAEDAARAADVALHAQVTLARARDAFGELAPLADADTFRFDYWPMELYKLTLGDLARPFAGTIQIVTGAASGIGRTTALELAARGPRARALAARRRREPDERLPRDP